MLAREIFRLSWVRSQMSPSMDSLNRIDSVFVLNYGSSYYCFRIYYFEFPQAPLRSSSIENAIPTTDSPLAIRILLLQVYGHGHVRSHLPQGMDCTYLHSIHLFRDGSPFNIADSRVIYLKRKSKKEKKKQVIQRQKNTGNLENSQSHLQ